MTWVDYTLIGVVVASVAWGVWRGLVREIVSLAGWVIAFLAANLLAGPVGERLPESMARSELRVLVAFVAVFIASLVLTTLAGLLLSKIVKAAGLGGLDRALGALFGLARGALIVAALALVAGLTSLPQQDAWRRSVCGPALERLASALKPWLPPLLSDRLRYH
ncbi:MAG: CvpA family protein [Clostridia bacterium]